MNVARYIEGKLNDSPFCSNKEELAEQLGVNYKTLCGWFTRNSFSVESLFSISRILEIDLEELRKNLPLTNKEVLQLYEKKYKKTPYLFEGYFEFAVSNNTEEKKLYSLSLDVLEVDMEIKFGKNIPSFTLKEEDIKELLKGYEISFDIQESLSFHVYIKKQGDYLIRKMLQGFTAFQNGVSLFANHYLTESDIDVFFERIQIGEYKYYGEVEEVVGGQVIEKLVEITPLDTKVYKNRYIYLT